jgi:hypothetical protein
MCDVLNLYERSQCTLYVINKRIFVAPEKTVANVKES